MTQLESQKDDKEEERKEGEDHTEDEIERRNFSSIDLIRLSKDKVEQKVFLIIEEDAKRYV